MATKIEWVKNPDGSSGETWNPTRGCRRVSPGCENCYAERQARRQSGPGGAYEGLTILTDSGPRWNGNAREVPDQLDKPLRWRKPRTVFVDSMSDLFYEGFSFEYIAAVFGVMAACPQHTFQILTKRADRMAEILSAPRFKEDIEDWLSENYALPGIGDAAVKFGGTFFRGQYGDEGRCELAPCYEDVSVPWPLPNVWLGVSIENQGAANERIPYLLQVPAAIRFVSAEPLLGPVMFHAIPANLPPLSGPNHADYFDALRGLAWLAQEGHHHAGIRFPHLDWVIVGGESGPGARPMHPEWARSIRDQCITTGVAFFYKQWGAWHPCDGVDPQPSDAPPGAILQPWPKEGPIVFRVGKKAAGRLLDGRTWDEQPEARRD
jgi:protein gp37